MAEPAHTSDLVVCRMGPSEWRTLRDVRLAMLLDTPAAFGSTYAREAVLTDADWERRVRQSRTWHARLGERPVGSVTSYRAPEQPEGEAHLVALWVSASARGQGVGDALVSALKEDARERGLRRLLLDVAHENASAIRLYRRTGFTATGRTSTLAWDPSVTEFEMECVLDG
jgi:ribosomal protein S18 acetylase RimI-like enzyme